jgi:GH35 family endo-1,4-beta-xylanase
MSVTLPFGEAGWTLTNTVDGRLSWPTERGPEGTAIARVETLKETANDWDIQFLAPNALPVKKGDTLLFSCWVRNPVGAHGMASRAMLVFQRQRAPYEHSLSTGVVAQTEWLKLSFPFTAISDYTPGEAKCCVWVSFKPQTIDIAGVNLTNYGPNRALDTLPHALGTYEGREPTAKWRKDALARIERIRKGDLKIDVVDDKGKPVSDARIAVRMKRHAFLFGSMITEQMMDDYKKERPDNKAYAATFAKLFNGASMGMMVWNHWANPYWHDEALHTLQRVHEMGYDRIHSTHLVWGNWRHTDPKVRTAYDAEAAVNPALAKKHLEDAIEAHIADEMAAVKGKISSYSVLNEDHDNHEFRDILGRPALLEWFKAARKADPTVKLFVNDYNIIEQAGMDNRRQDAYYDLLQYLTTNKAEYDTIGIQGHFGGDLTPPDRMLAILDRVAAFHKPIEITEFDVSVPDEQLQADFTRDFLISMFSHPSINGVTLWGFSKYGGVGTDMSMFRDDWTPKPNGLVYEDLVLHRWWTNADGVTDKRGHYATRGFLGEYEVTVTRDSSTVTKSVTLARDGARMSVAL